MFDPGERALSALPSTGTRLGDRYEIVSRVAAGGLGVVFSARDLAIQRLVAVKVLAPRKQQAEHAKARLFREARATARMAHPGIVQVFDQGEDRAFGPYLVMELLNGEDLSRLLARSGPLPESRALALLEQACSALQAAHDQGIYHRDLKPANLFLVHDPLRPTPLVKLIDFGVARFDGDAGALTEPGDVLGTIAYMAPERWTEPGGDARSEVYSLAAVAYEMLSGVRPFRAATQTALRLAIANDPPAPLESLCPKLDRRVARAIGRALCKAPHERFDSVRAFGAALGFESGAPSTLRAGVAAPDEFAGTERYRPRQLLARSRTSEVYVAEDRQCGLEVVLKRVKKAEPEALFRLKNEFRVAQEIEHPNLVRLHSLLDEGADVLIVMERVEGEPLLDYLASDEGRIRRTVAQLARALAALHARGLAHRDVKPDNVVVDRRGRAVLLDLGLAASPDAREAPSGTLPYLAPEVFEGSYGPESDLFALGVVLHQALTGELPERSETGALVVPSARLAGSLLGELCTRLLDADPSRRPSPAELFAELGEAEPESEPTPSHARSLEPLAGRDVFVGRGEVLDALEAAFREAASGVTRFVCVDGTSGIGKSTLIRRFHKRLLESTRAVVLSSRARKYESVPYPALDEAIDQLSSYLCTLSDAHVEALLSRHGSRLTALFPVLARVGAIARAAATPDGTLTPADVRRHASDALRTLLRRLSERHPLVLFVDDLQWLDPDSRALLVHVLTGAEHAPILVVGAVRSGDESDAVLRELEDKLPEGVLQRVELGPLSGPETSSLIQAKVGDAVRLGAERVSTIAQQTGGVPYFAELLAAAIVAREVDIERDIDMDRVLTVRQQRLPPLLRDVLELVVVSSRPLPVGLVLELGQAPELRALEPLVAGRLVRLSRSDGAWQIEPYHSRMRDAVLRGLDEGRKRELHARLAAALQRDEAAAAPELLVEHLAGSGDTRAAGQLAFRAAELAREKLAFGRAAALFGVALTYGRFEGERRVEVARRCAEALQSAGQRRMAGEVLLEAIPHATSAPEAELLRREAGTHFLLSGDIERGIDRLSVALRNAGLEYPSTEQAIPRTFEALTALEARGLSVRADAPSRGAETLDRVDLSVLLAQGLAHIDLRALPFACHALDAALDAGDEARLHRALAVFVVNTAGSVASPLIEPALELCRRLTRAAPSPYALALLYSAEGELAFFRSDFLAAEAWFERAERTLLASCAGTTRELATVRDMAVWVQYAQKGDFKSQVERTLSWLSEAESSRDLFHTGMLRVAHAIVWVAHDDPARARAELRKADAEWTGPAGVLQVGATLYHDVIDRYEENDGPPKQGEAARNLVANAPAAQGPFLSGYFVFHEIWRALRRIAHGRAHDGEMDDVREALERLRGLELGIWFAVADALEANADFLSGNREAAVSRLESAEQAFRRLHMLCLAACARKRRGQFSRDELGRRLEREADHELRTLGVAEPNRWSRAYWSMFDERDAELSTQITSA